MATARMRLAAIAAAHRLGGHEDPTTRPLVKATMKRLAREYGKPRKQAKGLTRSLAGNPDSPQASVFLTSIIDEIVDVATYYMHYHAI